MTDRISRFSSLTGAEVSGRIGEKIRTMGERFGERPGAILKAEFDGMNDAQAPLPTVPVPSLLEAGSTVEVWKERFPDSVRREISLAEGIEGGRIPVFSGIVEHYGGIDWHIDPVSGKRAPLRFYRDIDTLKPSVVGDAKNIWEINRCNFLVTLGRAYAATGRRTFYETWRGIVTSWTEANPYNRGVNWESSLELAFRAINWLWSASLFSAELAGDDEMRGRLMRSIYLHGRHIERHLSHYFSPNTHLTGEALGLLYIGRAYPGISDSSRWIEMAEEILETELRTQILPDGGYFEMTTWYHKYTIDFYLNYLLLSMRPGDESRSIVRRTVRHLMLLTAPDGTIPLLGDSDGGRLLFLSPSKFDLRGACCAAATLLGDGELKSLCGGAFEEEALWLLGSEGRKRFDGLDPEAPGSLHSVNDDTGLYCFRTGMGPGDTVLVIDCGPHGWKKGGHAHDDLLSFILYSGGDPVIVDPGTFTYSGSKEIRDESRGSLRHNTISLNDMPQSEPGGTFSWHSAARRNGSVCLTGGDIGLFCGTGIPGTFPEGRIGRIVLFFGGRLTVIFDSLSATGPEFSALTTFQFGDGTVEELGDCFGVFSGKNGRHYFRILDKRGFTLKLSYPQIYPDYGLAVVAPRLQVIRRDIGRPAWMTTVFSDDRGLLEGLDRGNTLSMASLADGVSFRLDTDFDPKSADPVDFKASGFLAEEDRTMVLLRRSRKAVDDGGNVILEVDGEPDFITAVIEGGTVRLATDGPVPPVKFSRPVDEIFLNGKRTSFSMRDGWIEMDRDTVKGN